MERENFSEGNFKVIKQFIVLERCLHFYGCSEGFPRYSDIVPVTLSKAKSLCVNHNFSRHLHFSSHSERSEESLP